jgi:Helix-turn-helix domain
VPELPEYGDRGMSWRASAYIKELKVCPNGEPLTRSEKLVAYALADSHQDRGADSHTFPSVEALAEDSLMTKRECQRILASLERKGAITRLRPTVQSRGMTTFYRFPQLEDSRVRVTPRPPLRVTKKGGKKGVRRVTFWHLYIRKNRNK